MMKLMDAIFFVLGTVFFLLGAADLGGRGGFLLAIGLWLLGFVILDRIGLL